jgi:hypothetical protein
MSQCVNAEFPSVPIDIHAEIEKRIHYTNEWRTIFANNLCEAKVTLDLCRHSTCVVAALTKSPPSYCGWCTVYSTLPTLLDPTLLWPTVSQRRRPYGSYDAVARDGLCCVVLIVRVRQAATDGLQPNSDIQDSLSSSFTPKASRRISRFSQYEYSAGRFWRE